MAFLLELQKRAPKVEVDSDDEVELQETNLMACGSGHYGRLAQNFNNTKNLNRFTLCNINAAVHPNVIFDAITCGAGHTLAISNAQQVYSWGKCHFGQLGHGQQELDRYLPRLIESISSEPIIAISAQDSASFAVSNGGELFSWGCGYFGALANGSETSFYSPQKVEFPQDTNIKAVYSGKHHGFAVSENGQIFAYGANSKGQLGLGDFLNKRKPTLVNYSVPVLSIACGGDYSWFITTDKIMLLGFENSTIREQDSSTIDGKIIQAAARHDTMALLSDTGKVYTFSNSTGKFFQSSLCEEKFSFVACGETHTLALNQQGNVFSWGNNKYHKLGRSTNDEPKIKNLSCQAKQVAAGSNHSFILLQSE